MVDAHRSINLCKLTYLFVSLVSRISNEIDNKQLLNRYNELIYPSLDFIKPNDNLPVHEEGFDFNFHISFKIRTK